MTTSETSALERVARVLCAQRISSNGEGSNPSAGDVVDAAWPEHIEDAVAVLKTLREPDPSMVAAGDGRIWEAMIHAALRDPVPAAEAETGEEPAAPGTDPFHEGP
jgi:hypothetical protein